MTIKPQFSVLSPLQCLPQAVVCINTPRMHSESLYILVTLYCESFDQDSIQMLNLLLFSDKEYGARMCRIFSVYRGNFVKQVYWFDVPWTRKAMQKSSGFHSSKLLQQAWLQCIGNCKFNFENYVTQILNGIYSYQLSLTHGY